LDSDVESVTVPEIMCPINEDKLQELTDLVYPTSESNNYGIDLYNAALQFVTQNL